MDSSFLHRADARCFLSGAAGQEDAPGELYQFAELQPDSDYDSWEK